MSEFGKQEWDEDEEDDTEELQFSLSEATFKEFEMAFANGRSSGKKIIIDLSMVDVWCEDQPNTTIVWISTVSWMLFVPYEAFTTLMVNKSSSF